MAPPLEHSAHTSKTGATRVKSMTWTYYNMGLLTDIAHQPGAPVVFISIEWAYAQFRRYFGAYAALEVRGAEETSESLFKQDTLCAIRHEFFGTDLGAP